MDWKCSYINTHIGCILYIKIYNTNLWTVVTAHVPQSLFQGLKSAILSQLTQISWLDHFWTSMTAKYYLINVYKGDFKNPGAFILFTFKKASLWKCVIGSKF